jgi:hypothetical protein
MLAKKIAFIRFNSRASRHDSAPGSGVCTLHNWIHDVATEKVPLVVKIVGCTAANSRYKCRLSPIADSAITNDAIAQAKDAMQINPNPFFVCHPIFDRHTQAELSLTFPNPSTCSIDRKTSLIFSMEKQGFSCVMSAIGLASYSQ